VFLSLICSFPPAYWQPDELDAGAPRERIEKTDRLIDAVVYRLYGLTEEEIGIVEGGKN